MLVLPRAVGLRSDTAETRRTLPSVGAMILTRSCTLGGGRRVRAGAGADTSAICRSSDNLRLRILVRCSNTNRTVTSVPIPVLFSNPVEGVRRHSEDWSASRVGSTLQAPPGEGRPGYQQRGLFDAAPCNEQSAIQLPSYATRTTGASTWPSCCSCGSALPTGRPSIHT